MSHENVLAAVADSAHQKVKVAVADIDGVLRGKYMHKDKFLSAAEGGFGFCDVVFGWDCGDVCYDNVHFTGWHTGYPDAAANIDLSTYRQIPWEERLPFFLADFKSAPACPRQLLRRVIARAEAMGYRPMFGLEFEWFNFKETPDTLVDRGHKKARHLSAGMFGYSILRAGLNRDFFTAIMDEMNAFGVPLEGLHTETGPGVYEAALAVAPPLEAADRAVLFKTGVKEIGYRFGVVPTFMAKIDPALPGCSGHVHQSLCDEHGRNLFHDERAPDKMSELFKHYIAGQMHCFPQILPMVAPTINSYKRLVEGMWAPTKVTWAIDNRTVAFRAIPGGKKSSRLETRVTGSDINPYLAVAAALAAGLYGIEQRLSPGDPIRGNGYAAEDAARLPANLEVAARTMAASELARGLFGDAFVEHFTNTRLWEWRQFSKAVTSWEHERYLEII
jgi:glutamine synthetase